MNRDLRKRILDLVDQLAESEHARQDFHAGQTSVPVSGKVYGSQELRFLVDASMDFWLTTGRYNNQFETQLADFLKTRHVLTTNSGSSANLLAVSALTSSRLKDRALRAGAGPAENRERRAVGRPQVAHLDGGDTESDAEPKAASGLPVRGAHQRRSTNSA